MGMGRYKARGEDEGLLVTEWKTGRGNFLKFENKSIALKCTSVRDETYVLVGQVFLFQHFKLASLFYLT